MSYHSDFTRGCASAARSLWKLAGKLIGHQPPPKTLGEKVQGCGCMLVFPLFFLTFWLVKWMVMATAALALITAATGCSLAAGVGLIVDLFPSKAKKAWIPPPPRIPPPPVRGVAPSVALLHSGAAPAVADPIEPRDEAYWEAYVARVTGKPAPRHVTRVTPDGKWITFDDGEHFTSTANLPPPAAPPDQPDEPRPDSN